MVFTSVPLLSLKPTLLLGTDEWLIFLKRVKMLENAFSGNAKNCSTGRFKLLMSGYVKSVIKKTITLFYIYIYSWVCAHTLIL